MADIFSKEERQVIVDIVEEVLGDFEMEVPTEFEQKFQAALSKVNNLEARIKEIEDRDGGVHGKGTTKATLKRKDAD